MMSAIATTNSGSDVTASATTEVTWSNSPSLRSADAAPRPTPITAPMRPVTKTSTAELISRGSTKPQTGCPFTREWPRLPVNSPDTQVQYWSIRGSFR